MRLILSVILIAASLVLYFIHYLIFQDLHHIGMFFLTDLAILPLEVVLVYIVLHSVLSGRGKNLARERLNSLMGIFFNEVGRDLLFFFSRYDLKYEETQKYLDIGGHWTRKDFNRRIKEYKKYTAKLAVPEIDFCSLGTLLLNKKDFLLKVFTNAGTFESGSITYIFHTLLNLIDNLERQKKNNDYSHFHLVVNIDKLYTILIYQWLNYMRYLNNHYPDYYSAIVRSIDDNGDVALPEPKSYTH